MFVLIYIGLGSTMNSCQLRNQRRVVGLYGLLCGAMQKFASTPRPAEREKARPSGARLSESTTTLLTGPTETQAPYPIQIKQLLSWRKRFGERKGTA